ncbi:MAG: site-specific integrase [Nanoarchaeota archaeon]|nr:site-specific integrase [Nanoarchaeota archaeon]
MVRIDPYNHKERYEKWKEKHKSSNIKGLSKANSDILKRYIDDMENGINISVTSKKGARSPIRLNTLITRLAFLFRKFEQKFKIKDITKIKEEHLHRFFTGMRNGTIKTKKIKTKDGKIIGGQPYKSTSDYVKNFKSFWHWHMKVNRKNGDEIPDLTIDLDTSKENPNFVYFTEKEFRQLANRAKYFYKVLMWFLYDTGLRAPQELVNIKCSDLSDDFKVLNIREEIVKIGSHGRRIKLMLCSDMIKEYVETKKINKEDYLFPITPRVANQYLKRLGKSVFNGKETLGGKTFSELTMYDFRHSSCCHWLPIYKSESALKYRFAWKKSDKIYYYSHLLGMKDTIQEEDMLIDTTKTELQQQLEKVSKDKEVMQEELTTIMKKVKNFEKFAPLLRILNSSPKALKILKEEMKV